VLDILLQSRRDKAAARRFFRRLMQTIRTVPRVVVSALTRRHGSAPWLPHLWSPAPERR
jgi:transposase-like protein